MKSKQQPRVEAYSPAREKRVADALRENLRKRKTQQQAKDAASDPKPQDDTCR